MIIYVMAKRVMGWLRDLLAKGGDGAVKGPVVTKGGDWGAKKHLVVKGWDVVAKGVDGVAKE